MSILNNSLLLGADAGAAGYQISRSLRFNSSDSAYCGRVFSTNGTDRKKLTFSFWVKLCDTSAARTVISGYNGSSAEAAYWQFNSGGAFSLSLGGASSFGITTTQVFRDPSAWYHFLVSIDTTISSPSSDRLKLYVNGAQVTTFASATYPTQNYEVNLLNAGTQTNIGVAWNTGYGGYMNGYLADIHFIDGQALPPSSFAETNVTTGQWVPKAYTGTYGTNGFRLDFSDNSAATATTLGKDRAGSNNWTPNNLSVTAGAGNDSLVDTPTSYGTDTGAGGEVRGNYATLNPLDKGASVTLTNGNLDVSTASTWNSVRATFGLTSGKWYWEYTMTAAGYTMIGIGTSALSLAGYIGQSSAGYAYYSLTGNKWNSGTAAAYGNSFTTNDVISVAFDADAGKIWFAKNGTWQASGDPVAGANAAYSSIPSGVYFPTISQDNSLPAATGGSVNAGARSFAYTAPSGFKALCDTNLPAPVVAKPSSAFDCVTYTGTGATLTPTSSLGFSPDLVWIKSRSAATDHTIYDAVRGTQARLESNNTDPEVTSDGGLTAFNSNGFTLGTLAQVNTNAATYVAWCWDEAVADGFDIVTYTGNGANRTIAHSLGVAPSFMIVKQRTAASATNWAVWHSSLANTEYLLLNSTAAKATGATYWNSTSPTSTNFSLGTAADVNTNNGTYVAYLWSSVVGYSSFGSYTGNGSSDGPFVYTGFRPRWVMIKNSSANSLSAYGSWKIIDASRDSYNGGNPVALYANASYAEGKRGNGDNDTYTERLDLLSNGFKLGAASTYDIETNESGVTYIYAAFAENPFQFARAR